MGHALLALAAAGVLAGPPRNAGGPVTQPALGVTLGGQPVLVAAAGERVVAFRPGGEAPAGFPFALGPGEVASGPPAAADMDGDGRPEIAVVTQSGALFLWSDGRVAPGFPVALGARARAGPSFADVDGDGRPEVLAGDEKGRLHAIRKSGREARGFPVALGAAVTSSASSSRFAGGLSLAVGCQDGRVHVLDGLGRERPGFPLRTDFEVTGAPAFADLDGDGSVDLIVASQDFKLHAVDEEGKSLAGFPVAAEYRLYGGPAVGDLDGDGALDVVFASADGRVYAVDGSGNPLRGFPVRAGARVFGGVALGDLDRDGRLEAVAVSSEGNVVAIAAGGQPVAGFPERLEGRDLRATPLLLDLAQDGSPAVVVGLPTGELHALRAPRSGQAAGRVAWAGAAHDAARTGRYGPNPPSYRDLRLEPERPRAGDRLTARWRWISLDALPDDPEPPAPVEWLRDGRRVPELRGRREVPGAAVRKGERWSFVVAGGAGTRVASGPEVTVANTPPGPPRVELRPQRPTRAAGVELVVTRPAEDRDGDPIRYRVEWFLDGLPTGVGGTSFPAERLRRGALLAARAVASDGEGESEPVVAEALVGDTAPGAPAVGLSPEAPRRAGAIAVKLVRPAVDPDGDPVAYHYRWTVGGQARNRPLGEDALPAGTAGKGQKVQVEVRAFDGTLEGPPAVAEATVANSPPGEPRVEIRPERPRRGQALRASLVAEAPDDDRDRLGYRWAWRKDGKPFSPADPREVPAAEVRRGDRFEVEAWASDGEAEGPRARAEVVVANTPPGPPQVAIEPERPRGGSPLRLAMVRPGQDADGDPVSYQIAWTRNGRPTGDPASRERLAPAFFAKGETVRVTVTPHDGREPGEPAAAEAVVANAPPTAPEVALVPARPVAGASVEASILRPAEDPDGDQLRYRYRWTRDGLAVAVPDGSDSSRREPFWTTARSVPASVPRRGQKWAVEVQAFDGEAHGPVARAEVVVANSPPPAPRVTIAPPKPRRGEGLRAVAEQDPDPDGDRITYRHAWSRNGARVALPEEQADLPRALPRKGERWAVEVMASDGQAEAAPARAEVVVGNAPPGPAVVALCERPVPGGTSLEVTIREPAVDPDGDPVSYRTEWSVNGRPVAGARGQSRLAGSTLRKHDRVHVTAVPDDGQDRGPEAAAECLVENTPPTAPEVAVEPAEPTASSGLAAVLRRKAADRDGDPVSYRHRWLRNGMPAGIEGARVPPGVPRHGETWRVVATPFDGEAEGEPASATALVANTPPPPPALALGPEHPAGGEALACEAKGPELDADREKVELRYRWLVNGKPAPVAEDRAALPAGVTRRGETWRCEAWTFDGFQGSRRVGAEVVVANSPPSAPAVAVEPEKAHREDGLFCRIAGDAVDPDGDPVRYAYAWFKDDQPVAAGADPTRVAPERIAKGQRWRCQVTASDGSTQGPPGRAERVVQNGPPGAARARIAPLAPREGQALRCQVEERAQDQDGDPVRYRYAWVRNGEAQGFAETSEEVPARLVQAGDRWRCQLTASDGEASGPTASSAEVLVTAGDSAEGPGSPRVSGRRGGSSQR